MRGDDGARPTPAKMLTGGLGSSPTNISALVLAAGRGARLRPYTDKVPKTLLPVLDQPLLKIIIAQLRSAGINQIGINAWHLAPQIERRVAEIAASFEMSSIDVRTEAQPSGPAGAVRVFQDLVRSSDVTVVVSGDALLALDARALIERHLAASATLTVVTKPLNRVRRFGVVRATDDGRVTSWTEKPALPDAEVHDVSCGVYALTPDVYSVLPATGIIDFGVDLAAPLIARGGRVAAIRQLGYWTDIGTPEALRQANLDAALGSTGIAEVNSARGTAERSFSALTRPIARSESVFVGSHATIHPTADIIGPAVIGMESHIGRGARIRRSVLLPRSKVPPRAVINDVII